MHFRNRSVAFVIEANYKLSPPHTGMNLLERENSAIFFLSVDNCKSSEQAKKEKRKPPGTVEYTVSECSHPLTSRLEHNIFLTYALWH